MLRRRWLQFSLRGFLISLALLSICLGWVVERARRRGAAIDAIAKAGAALAYLDRERPFFVNSIPNHEYVGHFWSDVKRQPVAISMSDGQKLDAFMGECLARAVPIQNLTIWSPVNDEALNHITYLNDGCSLVFYGAENVSEGALRKFEERLAGVKIETVILGNKSRNSK